MLRNRNPPNNAVQMAERKARSFNWSGLMILLPSEPVEPVQVATRSESTIAAMAVNTVSRCRAVAPQWRDKQNRFSSFTSFGSSELLTSAKVGGGSGRAREELGTLPW